MVQLPTGSWQHLRSITTGVLMSALLIRGFLLHCGLRARVPFVNQKPFSGLKGLEVSFPDLTSTTNLPTWERTMATPFDEMDLSLVPSRPSMPNTEETPCQRLEQTRLMIKHFTTTRD
ncbi:hypothetical protein TNCV_4452381 [Trichonephila clavipes]|nr:hypothetical protein TNCV_4452381 [Trichonephila clavipes]